MIYILDAYNVIHKIPSLEAALDKDLRSARTALIELCGRGALSRGDISKMILVFDGKSEFRDLPQSSPPKIELVFSETNEEADERREVIPPLQKILLFPLNRPRKLPKPTRNNSASTNLGTQLLRRVQGRCLRHWRPQVKRPP